MIVGQLSFEDDTVDHVVPLPLPLPTFKGTVFAPLREAVPSEFWPLISTWFLDAAVADNYVDEAVLTAHYENVFVHPALGDSFPIQYSATSEKVQRLQSAVLPAIFELLLIHGMIDSI